MALHSRSKRIALALFVLLSFAGGVIVLGGAAKATNLCHNDVEAYLKDELSGDAKFGLDIAGNNHLQSFPTPMGKSPNAVYDCGMCLWPFCCGWGKASFLSSCFMLCTPCCN
uniref:Uncharacterized protein n=1 Tax=Dunaliella tertiolecta TaxID=3047 RepID=A0A7S3QM23_DUNTE